MLTLLFCTTLQPLPFLDPPLPLSTQPHTSVPMHAFHCSAPLSPQSEWKIPVPKDNPFWEKSNRIGERKTDNRGHYFLPATPKCSWCTSLRPVHWVHWEKSNNRRRLRNTVNSGHCISTEKNRFELDTIIPPNILIKGLSLNNKN